MIPAWNMAGVIPPIRSGQPGHSTDRSPYSVKLSDVVRQLATSTERIAILNGLLNYRAALHKLGLVNGFQWLDGSFMQDVETHELRPPNDVDVVTYFYLPSGETQLSLANKAGPLLTNAHVKITYSVDAYPHILGNDLDERNVRQISYWYSMWAHRRDWTWKGFVQVSMDPQEDTDAMTALAEIQAAGANP